MEIWVPAKLYHALPLLCLVLGIAFLVGGSGAVNFILSVLLVGYACAVLGMRFWLFVEDWL